MKTVDLGVYFIIYNFIIGILLMIGSEKIGLYAGYVIKPYKEKAARLTHIGTFAFGACVATLTAGIYLTGYVLKL